MINISVEDNIKKKVEIIFFRRKLYRILEKEKVSGSGKIKALTCFWNKWIHEVSALKRVWKCQCKEPEKNSESIQAWKTNYPSKN